MQLCDNELNKHGYIFFCWTPAVGLKEQTLGYKVWIELVYLSSTSDPREKFHS
jgi:hypothetical protein